MVRLTVSAFVDAGLEPVVVVLGHERELITPALLGLRISLVANPDYEQGMSRAMVRGLGTLDDDIAAAVIGVADQPLLRPGTIRSLVDAYADGRPAIVAPLYAGRRGNPVLFDRRLFPELLAVTGDQGGRSVVERHAAEARWVEVGDPGEIEDVDTPQDLLRLD